MIGWASLVWSTSVGAQTVDQAEHSLAYLTRRVCVVPDGAGGFAYAGGVRSPCKADDDCARGTCDHEGVVVDPASLYPHLEFPSRPRTGGAGGEAFLRYVPLCEDGSGDHEYSMSGGTLGTPPTCAPADYIRCADGTRPQFLVDASATRSRDYLIHAGGGGHASSPGDGLSVWGVVNTDLGGAYTAPSPPRMRQDLTGLYDGAVTNPFSSFNRVYIEKCSADDWIGNVDLEGIQDFPVERVVAFHTGGTCRDANGDGWADCEDNLVDPNACRCEEQLVEPPASPDGSYNVYHHGARIVRAVVSDVLGGATGYGRYPLVDDGAGGAQVRQGDEALPRPTVSSRFVFTCHSSGCTGLQGGIVDDLHGRLEQSLGGDVDVRAVFGGRGNPAPEVEACVSEFDGVDRQPRDGVADHPGEIDDTCSVYDQVIDTTAASGEPMSLENYEPGGHVARMLDGWYEPRPGYRPPVDASCLAFHCPRAADWATDPACAPCNSNVHVLLNHLQTPFVYEESLRDPVQSRYASFHCESPPDELLPCDYNGDATGVDLLETHWRPLVRKQFADLFRYAETDRCEGGVGREWPYDHLMLLLPDVRTHDSLLDPSMASYTLDPAGPTAPTSMLAATWWFVNSTTPRNPSKSMCMEEATAGENAADFAGIPGCR